MLTCDRFGRFQPVKGKYDLTLGLLCARVLHRREDRNTLP
jgi:hypothetical protein